ncbi:MAG: rhodanese-like domain-containing protein [Dissulfurispiraceae bacterium]
MGSKSKAAVLAAAMTAGFVFFSTTVTAGDMSQKMKTAVQAKVAPEKIVTADEVARLVALGPEEGKFELVDSRPLVFYDEGHIPGAISIPYREFNESAGKLPKEKNKMIIFYCGSRACRLSQFCAGKAEKMGYTRVKVFADGLHAWKKAGNLVVSSVQSLKEYLEKGIPFVLIDLRPTDEAKRGHIVGAVSVPGKDLRYEKERFPSDKSAPIMLYDNDTKSELDDFASVRGWGYTNVAVLDGGLDEWKRSGGLVISGDVATRIVYVPKLRAGEISIEEFKRIAETSPADKLLLDVRDEDEALQGMLKGALNVPSWDLKNRFKDITRDKEIILYCDTGLRAEMAYHTLKEAGFKVRFLNANIKIDKDGKYTIMKE